MEKSIEEKIRDLMLYKIELMKAAVEEKIIADNINTKGIEFIITLLKGVFDEDCRVFLMGEGRSGLVGKGFAMRLRHMEFHAHFIGEDTAPRVREKDLVIVVSGSGTTKPNIVRCQDIITEIGSKIIVITSNPNSPLGRMADFIIKLPGRDEVRFIVDFDRDRLVGSPVLPLRTFFEALAGIFLDSVIEKLMKLTKTTEEKMAKEHAI